LNKIVSIKNTSAIFLATVLVLGTIATISPSFIVGVQAVPQYGMDEEYSYEQQNMYNEAMDMIEPTYSLNNEEYYNEELYSYDDSYNNDMYSKYPTKDKKFECEEGPFTGFFVSDPIFCDVELPAGSQGPQGPPGLPGPPGITFLNGINVYRVDSTISTSNSAAGATAIANCRDNDFAISGDALILNNAGSINNIFRSEPTPTGNGWIVTLNGGRETAEGITFQAVALCFDNPPLRTLATAAVSPVQQPEDSPIISQEIGNSPELTATEKTTKLKKQWLELLP
jgi:hypothetical protein